MEGPTGPEPTATAWGVAWRDMSPFGAHCAVTPVRLEAGSGDEQPIDWAPPDDAFGPQAVVSAAFMWSARMPGSSATGLRPNPQYAASPNCGRYLRANATRCWNRSILWIAPR
jgi:hypothetical protein